MTLELKPIRKVDIKAQAENEPLFKFGRRNYTSKWQRSYSPKGLDVFGGDFKFRSGHCYGTLPLFKKHFKTLV